MKHGAAVVATSRSFGLPTLPRARLSRFCISEMDDEL